MVLIKNHDWNYYTGELYKSYANQHQAETTLICCDSPSSPLKAHGLILAANSEWFELILKGKYNQEVPLPYKKNVMGHLINIIYKGNVEVETNVVRELFKAARGLKIKGVRQNCVNSIVKSEVPEEPPLFTSSPDRSVVSPVFDIPNSTVSDTSRLVKNPFADSKSAISKENNDSDETAVGSDDEVLVVENGVSSDIDVVMVDDVSPCIKKRSCDESKLNNSEGSDSKVKKVKLNRTDAPSKSIRRRILPGSVTPPSPELDVEALSPNDNCDEQQHIQEETCVTPEVQPNGHTVNTGNVDEKLKCLLESAYKKESAFTPDIKKKIECSNYRELTQLCVICCKYYSNIVVHKKIHKFEIKNEKTHKCSSCKVSFRTQDMFSLHKCKKKTKGV